MAGIAVLVVIIDQGTKLLARRTLPLHQFVPVLDSWLGLRRTYTLPPAFAGNEPLTTTVAILAIIALFLIVWRGAWGQRSAVVGLGIVLGGALSSLFDQFYLGASTAFLFLRLGTSGRIETNLSLVAVIAGTIVLAVAAGMGRLPRDSMGPTLPRRRIRPTV